MIRHCSMILHRDTETRTGGRVDQNIVDLFHKLADCSAAEREEYYGRHRVGDDRRAEVEALLRFDKTTNQSVAGHVAFVAREALEEEGATQVMKPEERLSHRSAPAAPDGLRLDGECGEDRSQRGGVRNADVYGSGATRGTGGIAAERFVCAGADPIRAVHGAASVRGAIDWDAADGAADDHTGADVDALSGSYSACGSGGGGVPFAGPS